MKYIHIQAILLLTTVMSFAQSNEVTLHNEIENTTAEDTIKKKKRILDEVTITSSQVRGKVNAGKVAIKAIDLPQATAIISSETLEQQQVLRLSDVVKNTNGIYVSGASNASGNNQEELGSRGFTFSGANTFKNGVRINGSIIPEAASLENVEVLKGSGALLYGNVAPGGILNLTTKKPQFTNGGEISFRAGSYDFYKPTVDLYGAINNSQNAAFRIITSYEKANSFRDVVKSERIYFNPSFLLYLSDKTNLLIEADYTKDNRTPDFGLTTINYEVQKQPRNTYLGFNWAKFNSIQQGVTTTLTHSFNNNWQLKAIGAYQGFNTELFGQSRPNSGDVSPYSFLPTAADNNLVRTNGDLIRGAQRNKTNQDYVLAELDLTGKFNTATIKHNLLVGVDADRSLNNTINYRPNNKVDKINIFQPINHSSAIPLLERRNTILDTETQRIGAYVQDFIEFTPYLKALAGIRYSYLENSIRTLTFNNDAANLLAVEGDKTPETHNNIITSKLGIVLQPSKHHSFFASYADSFVLNTGIDRFENPLPASTIDQYEVGIKNEFFNNLLNVNVTGYIINNSNVAQTDFSNGNTDTTIRELAGDQRTKGFETDITAHYKGVKAMAGYSFTESKVTSSNIMTTGTLLRFYPKHTANASLFYTFENTFLKGLELGVMSQYVGERLGGRIKPTRGSEPDGSLTAQEEARKQIPMDDFIQLDASIGYSFKNMSLRTKVNNIGNVYNYYVYDDNTVTPIAPTMFTTTFSYKF